MSRSEFTLYPCPAVCLVPGCGNTWEGQSLVPPDQREAGYTVGRVCVECANRQALAPKPVPAVPPPAPDPLLDVDWKGRLDDPERFIMGQDNA